MAAEPERSTRCGIDTVEIARIERLLRETPSEDLRKLFSAEELRDAGEGPGRAASLAARFAAKEACLKLFPREAALGLLAPADFSVIRDSYGAPRVVCSSAAVQALNRHRYGAIALSLSHDRTSGSAVAIAEPARVEVPWFGKFAYYCLPIRRRVVLANLRRAFGTDVSDAEIRRLAQAHYGHLLRMAGEFFSFPWRSPARQEALVRVENVEAVRVAAARGKGILVLTGHFGNWAVSTIAGIRQFPEGHGRFHFVRRPHKPRWLEALITRRMQRATFGVLLKRGSLDAMVERLAAGDVVVFPFDQHADRKDGIRVDFFGQPAGTFRSPAIIALATGAAVMPASSWREPDGRHVLRFEDPLPLIECDDVDEAIRRNTQAFNAALERLILRHPEQWWWVHRRWKAG